MPATQQKPVLIIGGSGVVGARAAKTLRRLQPGLHLPETLIDPAEMVRRLERFGTQIREVRPAG